jgi:hypothetical protein
MTARTAYAISHATPTRADATIAPADGRTSSQTAIAAPATARITVTAAWPGASPRQQDSAPRCQPHAAYLPEADVGGRVSRGPWFAATC